MRKNRRYTFISVTLMLFALVRCIEPFDFQTQGFEGILVVDARLTDVKNNIKFYCRGLDPLNRILLRQFEMPRFRS